MDLRKAILTKYSKAHIQKIVKWVGHSQDRFDELFQLFLSDDFVIAQRAGYPLSYCVESFPDLMRKHLGKLLKYSQKKGRHNAVKRNTVRILQFIEIPKRYHGTIMTICFEFIEDPEQEVAVKAFSLAVLEKMLPLYPDIFNELKLIIEERWQHETAAFHSRARKILNFKFKI
jgi:hypothetical protein